VVAEGVLDPYQIKVWTCTGGREAVALTRQHAFDLVLMDHMMPEMDGVEATAAIRALGDKFAEMPIIALTANVVGGMREMFLTNGFNDFLPKPIELSRLDGLLKKWLPADKCLPLRGADASNPPPFATSDGEAADTNTRSSDSARLHLHSLEMLKRDLESGLVALKKMPVGDELQVLAAYAHDLKNALAHLGDDSLSGTAAQLETAARANDFATLAEKIAPFREKLLTLIPRLTELTTPENPNS
jgi:CheY-like chemotaxis protein